MGFQLQTRLAGVEPIRQTLWFRFLAVQASADEIGIGLPGLG